MSDYIESVRIVLLKELENREITESEFWEYYNEVIADYNEAQQQQAQYYVSVYK